jgi:hypothetical protein
MRLRALELFLIGAGLRGIPELIVRTYPVGYDTMAHYTWNIIAYPNTSLVEQLREAPLFYMLAWISIQAPGLDVFTFLKIAGPLMYGITCASLYFFFVKACRLDEHKSFIAAILFAVQLAALRISWDMLRLELGLTFAFLALGIEQMKTRIGGLAVPILAVLSVMSNQIAAVVLLFATGWLTISKSSSRRQHVTLYLPALFVFVAETYVTFFVSPVLDPRILEVGAKGSSFLTPYFELDPRLSQGSYLIMTRNVVMLTLFCFALLSPFILKGFAKNRMLDPILVLTAVGSFSPLVLPWVLLPVYYWRWIFLLAIPFAAYAALGLDKFRFTRRKLGFALVLLLVGGVAVGYASGTLPLRQVYFTLIGTEPTPPDPNWGGGFNALQVVNTYVPASLASNSIATEDVTRTSEDTVEALKWLNTHAGTNSCLLVEERFRGLTMMYLDSGVKIALYGGMFPISKALEDPSVHSCQYIYFLWYSGQRISNFVPIQKTGTMTIYEYVASDAGNWAIMSNDIRSFSWEITDRQ